MYIFYPCVGLTLLQLQLILLIFHGHIWMEGRIIHVQSWNYYALFAGRNFFQGLLIKLLLPLFAEWAVLPVWASTINSYLFSSPSMSSPFILARINVKVLSFSLLTQWKHAEVYKFKSTYAEPRQWMDLSHLGPWWAGSIVGKDPVTNLIKSSVGYRTGLDILEKRQIPCIFWNSNPSMSSC